MINVGALAARRVLEEHGIDDPTNFPLEDLVEGLGALLQFVPMNNCDGRIVFGDQGCLISINSGIEFEGRRRFTLAHELGHFVMHRALFEHHNDTESTMSWFDSRVNQLQRGRQEQEANEFASELLMPERLFKGECSKEKFSPDIIRRLSEKFQTSKTSAAFRYVEHGNHPICILHCHNGRVKYYKKSRDFLPYPGGIVRLATPELSVAAEFFRDGIWYTGDQAKQSIQKSTWFELSEGENEDRYDYYEYCIITPKYDTVLSVVWDES